MRYLIAALLLAGCESAYTPEGCQIFYGEIMRAHTEACVAAYRAEKARQEGAVVTECFPAGGALTCVTQ